METMGEAKEYCWSIGGYLAEIITEEEESLLDNYLISGISYWIGLSDMDHEGLVLVKIQDQLLIHFRIVQMGRQSQKGSLYKLGF